MRLTRQVRYIQALAYVGRITLIKINTDDGGRCNLTTLWPALRLIGIPEHYWHTQCR